MWTMWHQQNLDWTGQDRIGSHCSFRFADLMWFSIIWSCILNSTWDFDLAMGSSKVNQFVNYGFQQWKKLKNVKKQLDCDEMIHTSNLPSSMVALHYTPWHSHESDYMGFWGKKKLPEGPTLYYVTLFWLVTQKFYFTWFDPWSLIRDSIRDPVRDPIRDPIPSDPDFVDAANSRSF